MLIREYTQNDIQQIRYCLGKLQEYERSVEPNRVPNDQIGDNYWNYLIDETNKKKGKIFVAEDEGKIVGIICVWVEREIEMDSDYLYVSDWIVLEEYRGKGLGKALIEQAQDYATSIGLKIIRLGVLINNELAKDVYYKLGFRDYSLILTKNI